MENRREIDMAIEDQEDATSEEPSGVNKKKIIILASICFVLIVISAVGTLFALDMFSGAEEEMLATDMIEAPEEGSAAPVTGPAIYYPLKPPIIVNFQARGRQRFLQADLTLMTRDESVIRAIEVHMPMIRNSLILLFGGQVYEELQTAEGKALFQEQALAEVQRLMTQEIGKPGVEQVLFTNFVMQ